MKEFHLAICDDDQRYAESIRRTATEYLASQNLTCSVQMFCSGKQLVEQCILGELPQIHLLFLDIEMDEMDGITVKDFLSKRAEVKRIVFLSSHVEMIQMAFGLRVIGFLHKPAEEREIRRYIDIVRNELDSSQTIAYENNGVTEYVESEEIMYIMAEKDYSCISRHGKQETRWIRMTLKQWELLLPADRFVRVHKSYIVNLAHIKTMGSEKLLVGEERTSIPLGRRYSQAVKGAYMEYIMKIGSDRV